jgi:PPP family 3-phenylpropionic acid transporter
MGGLQVDRRHTWAHGTITLSAARAGVGPNSPHGDPGVRSIEEADRAGESTPWTLRAIYVVIGCSTASIAPFVPVILKERGVSPAAIGFALATAALLTTVVVPAWGHVADAMLGRVRAFRIGLIVAAGAAGGLMLNLPLVLIVATVVSFTVFASLFLGLTDALAVAELTAPERQYGALRAHASLSYAIALVGIGFLYSWAGYGAAPAVFLVWAGIAFFLVGRVRGRTSAASTRGAWMVDAEPSRRLGSIGRAFSVQPRLWLVLAVFAVAFAGMQAALAFIGIRIVELGGQPSDVALSFSVSALTEIPGLVAAGWMGRRLGLRWLFAISLVLYGACITSWGILPSALAINATRLVTGVAFGSLTAARVLLVPRLLPEKLQTTGQVLVVASTTGLGAVLGSMVGGVAYGSVGPTAFFLGAGGVAIVGGIASWFVLAGTVGGRLRTRDAARS